MRKSRLALLFGVALLALMVSSSLAAKGGKKPPPPPEPEPPPDAAIAYAAGSRLMVANADGTNETVVLDALGAPVSRPDWSPDGEQLVFSANLSFGGDLVGSGIYVIGVDGTGLRKVTPVDTVLSECCDPVWSPVPVPGVGGSAFRIAYTDPEVWELCLVNLDGSNHIQLTDTPAYGECYPTWSPSGAKLACTLLHPAEVDAWATYDFATSTYTIRHLEGPLEGGGATLPLAWSKTQEDKVAWTVSTGGDLPEIWVIDLDEPANPLRITHTPNLTERCPSWSPDDSQIAVMSAEVKNGRLKNHAVEVMSATDGSARQVILERGVWPVWRRNP
ncbi:MAG: TolB family protein [Planctomycetota bacterium]|jgi:Tol biopolymer transport system component